MHDAIVQAIVAGDERAWRNLVGELDRVLRGVVRRYRLSPTDVDDVVQATWLRAFDHLDRIHDHRAIAGWLVVTARREAMRTLQRGVREVLVDDPGALDAPDSAAPETVVIQHERDRAVQRAVERLGGRQRALMSCLLASPAPTYEQLAAQLDMPIGSIGPTRDRALARLRADRELGRAVA